MRACLCRYAPTDFLDDEKGRIPGAMLFQVPITGRERLLYMYRSAVGECLSALPHEPDQPLPPFIVLGGEGDGEHGRWQAEQMDWLLDAYRPEDGHDPRTRHVCAGKAGIAEGLLAAREILTAPDAPEYVIVAGVDSFLEPETFIRFMNARRIFSFTNSDGFVPGEAGTAIALSARSDGTPGLWIEGVGQGHEPASPESNEVPLFARGLTDALRAAADDAGLQPWDYAFHASAVTGEQWYYKETSLAVSRFFAQNVPEPAPEIGTGLICRTTGEIGAASGPLGLAWAEREMAHGTLGTRGLLHFSNHNGQRAALAVNYRV